MRQRAFDAGVRVVFLVLVLGLARGCGRRRRCGRGKSGCPSDRGHGLPRGARMSATTSPVMRLFGPLTNTHSACVAAKRRPRLEEPAWYSTGVRCGDGSDRWMAST